MPVNERRISGRCPLPQLPKPFNKPQTPYNPEELTDLEKRWRRLYGQIRMLSYDTDNARELAMQKRLDYAAQQGEWMLKVGETSNLKPRNVGALRDWLARNFAVEYEDFMQTKLSDVGEVHQKLRRMKTFVETDAADKMAQIEALHSIGEAQRDAHRLMKKLPKAVRDKLWTQAQEEGQVPRLAATSGLSPLALRKMHDKYERFVQEAIQEGLTKDQVNELTILGAKPAAAYDEALALAKGSGIPMGEVSALGYFRRKFTTDVSEIIARKKAIMEGGLDHPDQLYQSFQKSRSSYEFLVEDEHLLAYALGRPLDSMGAIVADSKQLTKLLLDLPPEKLDSLVKMGVVGKIPLTSTELAEQLIKRYELPVKNLNEIFITDQVEGYRQYVQNLKNMVSDSTILQGIFKEGADKGWAITGIQKEANPDLYKGFVPLDDNLLGKFINQGRLAQYKKTGAMYVHPVVRDQLAAVLDIATSPGKMGMVAEFIQHHTRFMMKNSKGLMLAVPRFAVVNTIGGIIQGFTRGGNMLTMVPNYLQYIRVMHAGEGVLDNTVKAFAKGTMTERELYKHLVSTGGLNDFIPGIAIRNSRTGLKAWNITNAPNAARYAYYTLKNFGLEPGVRKVEEYISNLIEEPVMALGITANISDNAHKWNVYKTILSDNPLQQAGGFLTTGIYKNFGGDLDGARTWVDQAFFDYSNRGKVDRAMSEYVEPFWMYLSRNLPLTIRHAIQNPQQYLAYHRIHAVLNDPMNDEGDKFPVGALNKFTRDAFPLIFKTGDDDYFAVHTTSYDPLADGFMSLERLATDVQYRVTGKYTGTDEQKRRQASGEYTSDFLQKYAESMYPIYKTAIQGLEFLSGAERDALTGKRLQDSPEAPTSFLGVKMHPLARLFLEQNFPLLATYNSVNPGGAFGQPLKYDEKGNITQLPQPSVFGAPRTDKDYKSQTLRTLSPFIGSVGTEYDASTRALNMGYTEGDMKTLDKELVNRVKSLTKSYPLMTEGDKKNAVQEMENARNILFTLRLDLARIEAWRRKYGIPSSKVAKELAIRKLTVQDLPVVQTSDEARKIERLHNRFDTFDLMVQEEQRKQK